ncbi:MAG: sulfatase [Chitinophagaceae bacterium]
MNNNHLSFFKIAACLFLCFLLASTNAQDNNSKAGKKPNILFCIADDASFQHFSAYGFGLTSWVKTPGFDRVAKEGLLFNRAYTPNAKCAPSRACILTGRNSWQLEAAGNHNAIFPEKFSSFIEVLGKHGYLTGYTGKGWAPGNSGTTDGKPRLLTGPNYSTLKTKTPTGGISPIDYAANFSEFLKNKPADQPFCFWFGSHEPHRQYDYGSGMAVGNKKITDITAVPPFWIDNETVRNDMLDYAYELEYYDSQVVKMLDLLERTGELDNTIIVVTSDNGMPFPRVKGHMYDYDNHLPLAIMWKNHIVSPGRKINDFVSFIDYAPTFLEVAGINASDEMQPIQGKSLTNYFTSKNRIATRDHVLLGREREDVGRPHDEGYPVRAIVKGNYFYSINFKPDRWPSGNPETGYLDTDGSPTKSEILAANRNGAYHNLWVMDFGKKPAEELYQTDKDPYSIKNLSNDPAFAKIKAGLKAQLERELKTQQDPRMFGKGDVFDNYPYAEPRVINFYERYMKGEMPVPNFVRATDFEKPGFDPATPKKTAPIKLKSKLSKSGILKN